MTTTNESVNKIKRLIARHRKEHNGADPSPQWIVDAVNSEHPATDQGYPFAMIDDPAWWEATAREFRSRAEAHNAQAAVYERELERRRSLGQ